MKLAILAFALIVVGLGCVSETDEGIGGTDSERVRETEAALSAASQGAQQEITIASLPYAVCALSSADSNDSMEVYADDEGLVHLWAEPSQERDAYTLNCGEPNGMAQYKFDRSDVRAFRHATARVRSKDRTTRPGLADPDALSQQELTAAGYPPRPEKNSPGYAPWLEMVSQPVTLINPPLIDTHFYNDPETPVNSSNWAGLAIDWPNATYTLVNAVFAIPAISGAGKGEWHAVFWSGLGGGLPGDNAIIQQGIDTKYRNHIITYQPWIEYFPLGQQNVPFTMNPGDLVQWVAWECDANTNYGPNSHGYGCFTWWDSTRQLGLQTQKIQLPSNSTFFGSTCEAIVERRCVNFDPTTGTCVNDNYYWIPSWSGAANVPYSCYDAGQYNYWTVDTDPFENITITNASNSVLASASKTLTPTPGANLFWSASH